MRDNFMVLDHATVLAENLKKSFSLYERYIVWAMTASAAFFMITFTLDDEIIPTVSVLYGKLSGPAAWYIAKGLFLVLGILAASTLKNVEAVCLRFESLCDHSTKTHVDEETLKALMLYPSLATNPNNFIRIGTALFSPIAILVGFGLQLYRELPKTSTKDIHWWLGLCLFILTIWAPYAVIVIRLWNPLWLRYNHSKSAVTNSRAVD
jgi:hypothetical protein